ncbi:hypothetical protein HI914_04969 [Erysiphe necator]|uniref:Uncharacterized protein n=1 Tax=Uncinula necator TaxID=52586 RepID=A0A0B1PG93_UNCNE|nr:hypothetical protein HI914_04969 [Erysiphe necator]KHJ35609.1 hypothetical protein EV44_g2891 [Erysiphe necator]
MKACPAYVEELDENDQILPGTRRTARAPTTEHASDNKSKTILSPNREKFHQSEVNISDIKSKEKTSHSPKKNPISIKIPASQSYPLATMAGNYNSYYYGMPPSNEGHHQYYPQPHDSYSMMINDYSLPPEEAYAMSTELHSPPPPHPQPMSGYYQYPSMSPTAISCFPPHSPSYVRYSAQSSQDYGYQSHQEYAYPPLQEYSYPPTQEYSYPPLPRTTSRSLAARFQVRDQPWDRSIDPISRTASAFGTRDFPRQRSRTLEEGYESASDSHFLRNRAHERRVGAIGARSHPRESFNSESTSGNLLPRDRYIRGSQPRESSSSNTKSQESSRARRPSVSFDLSHKDENPKFEPPANSSRRRQCCYDQSTPESFTDYESKLKMASSYQEEAMGPNAPLPKRLDAPQLRKLQKRLDNTNRTSKSSASRDGSDLRKSETRTNRSGSPSEDQNVTIKVLTGSARVTLGGAQIDCSEGGAIEIKHDKVFGRRPSPEYINSEPSVDDHERRHRLEKQYGRPRVSSRAHRHSPDDSDYYNGSYR